MAVDRYADLPGMISEIQDGGLQINEENAAPRFLILGTAQAGLTDSPVQVSRSQEIQARFGKSGTLVRGMYESLQGGAQNAFVMRIGAQSAILYGVGSDDLATNRTEIETLLKDSDAADLYLVRYVSPATLGPDYEEGHLIVKNILGTVVYDNNPDGIFIDSGEIFVNGELDGGTDIGDPNDQEDFVSLRDIAADELEGSESFSFASITPVQTITLAVSEVKQLSVILNGSELASTDFSLSPGTGTNGEDQVVIVPVIQAGDLLEVNYIYDGNSDYFLKDGKDGVELSKMEIYEALDKAYAVIETEDYQFVQPMDIELDTPNVANGAQVILATDPLALPGRVYPVKGSKGDALGKLFKEEFDGETFYFWDINGDGVAEIFPNVGQASATTKIDGSALDIDSFREVNFAYQYANFCYSASSNEYNVIGVIGTSMPKSFSPRDISRWIGKEAVFDDQDNVIENGTGLLGEKLMVGTINNKPGLFATSDGEYQGASGSIGGNVEVDRAGLPIDIGRYLSVYTAPHTFFNPIDSTGFGYNANGAAFYAGFISTLVARSAPTNKIAPNTVSPLRLSKAKLNSLAKFGYVSLKQKNRVLRFSDSPTAARPGSDFRRLTTIRVVSEMVDNVRRIAEPYIGEPNTAYQRTSLETNLIEMLRLMQEEGSIQRFECRVSSSREDRINGKMYVEIIIVPPFEVRKIHIITSLAKE